MTTKKQANKPLSIKKALNKSELTLTIAERTNFEKKKVRTILEALTQIISAHITKKGPGMFVLPGIAKFKVVHKPATKKRKGKNPFTGKEMIFAAKPARNVVKIKPLKKIKDIAK